MSVVWVLALPLMNSFNKTEPAFFPMHTTLSDDFPPFSQIFEFILLLLVHPKIIVLKM